MARTMTLSVGDSEQLDCDSILKDSDFIDSNGKPNSETQFINKSENPEVDSTYLKFNDEDMFETEENQDRLKNIKKVQSIINDLENDPKINQISLESIINELPNGFDCEFLPLNAYTHYPSKIHAEDTIKRLKSALNQYSNESFFIVP